MGADERYSFDGSGGTNGEEIEYMMKEVSEQEFVIRSRIKNGTNNW
jgi:hypothetical protein